MKLTVYSAIFTVAIVTLVCGLTSLLVKRTTNGKPYDKKKVVKGLFILYIINYIGLSILAERLDGGDFMSSWATGITIMLPLGWYSSNLMEENKKDFLKVYALSIVGSILFLLMSVTCLVFSLPKIEICNKITRILGYIIFCIQLFVIKR